PAMIDRQIHTDQKNGDDGLHPSSPTDSRSVKNSASKAKPAILFSTSGVFLLPLFGSNGAQSQPFKQQCLAVALNPADPVLKEAATCQ
ncbi:hypothetical protein ACLOJK_040859, partial [Asimina triloba]